MADSSDNTIQWATIAAAPAYQVSNRGDVRKKAIDPATGEICWLPMKTTVRNLYPEVGLRVAFRKCRGFRVHRLVLEAFGPPQPSSEHIVAHNDGNALNPHISNLRWATMAENQQDRVAHGTDMRGTKHPLAKLNEASVRRLREICSRPGGYGEFIEECRKTGVSKTSARRAVTGKTWAHVK